MLDDSQITVKADSRQELTQRILNDNLLVQFSPACEALCEGDLPGPCSRSVVARGCSALGCTPYENGEWAGRRRRLEQELFRLSRAQRQASDGWLGILG